MEELEDATVGVYRQNREETMRTNMRNHFQLFTPFTIQSPHEFKKINYFHEYTRWVEDDGIHEPNYRSSQASPSFFYRYDDDAIDKRIKIANYTTMDERFFRRCMQGWVTQQSIDGHFMCTLCGRQAIVDITAVQSRASPSGCGVCMSCCGMKGLPVQSFTDHAMNDVFFQQVRKELFITLKGKVEIDMDIDQKPITAKDKSRPDISLFLYDRSICTAIFIECDPGEKSSADIDKRDDTLLRQATYNDRDVRCIMSVIVRFNTYIDRENNNSTNLQQNLWQMVRLLGHLSLGMFESTVHTDTKRVMGRLFLNYDLKPCQYTMYGFKFFSTDRFLNTLMAPLLQDPALNKALSNRSSCALFHQHRPVLYEVMRNFHNNPFLAFYSESLPLLAFIRDPSREEHGTRDEKRAEADRVKDHHGKEIGKTEEQKAEERREAIRKMQQPEVPSPPSPLDFHTRCNKDGEELTQIHCMTSLHPSDRPVHVSVNSYFLRLSKEMLATMIFLLRNRAVNQYRGRKSLHTPSKTNRDTLPKKRGSESMEIAVFMKEKLYF